MLQDPLFHVGPPGYARGDVIAPGRFGASLRICTPQGPGPKGRSSLQVLLWEMAFETARQTLTPHSVSRLDCVFACESEKAARIFRDEFRSGSTIYAVTPELGSPLHRGDYGLITRAGYTASYLDHMPPTVVRYWTQPPGDEVEILVGGSVTVVALIEAASTG